MKTPSILLLTSCCMLLGGCITPKSSTTAAVITGRVVDASACRPVGGRLLEILDTRHPWWANFILTDGIAPTQIGSTRTDFNGRYSVSVSGRGRKDDYRIWFTGPYGPSTEALRSNFRFIDGAVTPEGKDTLLTGRIIDISTAPPLSGKVVKIYDTWECPFLHNKSPRLIGITNTGTYGNFRLDVLHRFNDNYVSAEVTVAPKEQASWRVIDMFIYQNRSWYEGTLDYGLKYDVNSKSESPPGLRSRHKISVTILSGDW